MPKNILSALIVLSCAVLVWLLLQEDGTAPRQNSTYTDVYRNTGFHSAGYGDGAAAGVLPARPYVRWWWFADSISAADVKAQLQWVKRQGFGGVEIAFVYPLHGDTARARLPWLSREWSAAVAHAAQTCDALGLGCDFTFGTLWPFGDSRVPEYDGTRVYGEKGSPKGMRLTWEHPRRGRVINHLDRRAFARYAARVGAALAPALRGRKQRAIARGLFCDSWEVETRGLWTPGLDTLFQGEHGYDIRPLMDSLYLPGYEGAHYDYMKIVSRLVREEFYRPFTAAAHVNGAYTRAQCCGAPTELLAAYGAVDVPETEAILFEPGFARIPASAAALGGKPYVSAETFTCIYGWKGWPGPGPHQGSERVEDLRPLADALFAHGVNHIVWHGMPYNPPGRRENFYAAVHVAPDAAFAPRLRAFNDYLAAVSAHMRRGRSAGDIAAYLPTEDAWMDVLLPDSLQFPWAWGRYEMRYVRPPEFLRGYQPLWVNAEVLREGRVRDGFFTFGDLRVRALYVDARYLDRETLAALDRVAAAGLEICLARIPQPPGRYAQEGWEEALAALRAQPSVHGDVRHLLRHPPLAAGVEVPPFWCREEHGEAWFFFAHPDARYLRYPLRYGQAEDAAGRSLRLRLHWGGEDHWVRVRFAPGAGTLLHIGRDGRVRQVALPEV
jgi:hypothetical protein